MGKTLEKESQLASVHARKTCLIMCLLTCFRCFVPPAVPSVVHYTDSDSNSDYLLPLRAPSLLFIGLTKVELRPDPSDPYSREV